LRCSDLAAAKAKRETRTSVALENIILVVVVVVVVLVIRSERGCANARGCGEGFYTGCSVGPDTLCRHAVNESRDLG
jgi:hypothetical protein